MTKMLTGMATGLVLGAAASMLVMPELDKRTKKKLKKGIKAAKGFAGSCYNNALYMFK
ncbi:MAG: YtxH domain-containing protein [Oscillospiraceae bacterium]|nr:YtxH domain-containing protein [Oscillospiraceae bacterium]